MMKMNRIIPKIGAAVVTITVFLFAVFIVAATIFWRKNAQIDWHKTAINDVTNFFKQRKHALCEKYYGAVFALIENFLTGNWAA